MNNKTIIAIVVFILFISLWVWTQSQNSEINQEPAPTPVVAVTVAEAPKKVLTGEVIRRTRVQQASDFIENIFYIGEDIIGRQKLFADGKIEKEGEIPEGKVKFYNEYEHTFGEEFYYQGKKHGRVLTYAEGGELKSDAQYVYGQLVKNKEYYSGGLVRFEVDFSDAILGAGDQKEIGIGKLYYPDGKLKYEWNLTRLNKGGYKRSYNQDGTLRAESRFNEFGQFINEVRPPVVEEVSQ